MPADLNDAPSSSLKNQQKHVHEVNEKLIQMDELLVESLKHGMAEKTGYRIACAMKYADGCWSIGVNDERITPFLHAEIATLTQHSSNSPLTHVHLVGAGEKGHLNALKHAIPCEDCTHAIEEVAVPEATVTLFTQPVPELDGHRLGDTYRLADIAASYKNFDNIPVAGNESLEEFLMRNTRLIPADRRVLNSMREQLTKTLGGKYELYLTGSATGRNGPTSLIAQGLLGIPYGDMDLVLITSETISDLDKAVKSMYEIALQGEKYHLPITSKEVIPYLTEQQLGKSFVNGLHARIIYTHSGAFQEDKSTFPKLSVKEKGPSAIDVTFGNNFREVMTPGYLDRGWYVKLK